MNNHIVSVGIPRRLGHLPLVMDVLRRTGLLDVIDHSLRDDPRCRVSTSECVSVMLCGVFVGNHDLWRMSEVLAGEVFRISDRFPWSCAGSASPVRALAHHTAATRSGRTKPVRHWFPDCNYGLAPRTSPSAEPMAPMAAPGYPQGSVGI